MQARILPLIILALSLLSAGELLAQTPKFRSQPIAAQTDSFHIEFAAAASVDSINAIVGLGPVAAAAFNDLNVLIRFNDKGRLDAYNLGADGGPYVALASVPYKAKTLYYFSVDVNIAKKTYDVSVTVPGGGTTLLAEDFKFREANFTGTISQLSYAQPFFDDGSDAGKYLGVSHVQIGKFDGDNFNRVIPTLARATRDSFTIKFDALPTANNADGVVGFGGKEITAFGDFNIIVRFNNLGRVDVRNGGAYAAESDLAYAAGKRYGFYVYGRFSDSTYSVIATDEDGARYQLATGYKFRTNNFNNTLTNFAVKRNGGQPIGIDGLRIGRGGFEGAAFVTGDMVGPLPDVFDVSYVVTPSGDSIDAALALGPIPSIQWNDYNMIVRFNNQGAIDVRNGGGYAALTRVPYRGGRGYIVRIVGNTTARTYDVFVTDRTFGTEVKVAENYAFRGTAAGPIMWRHTKEVVGYLTTTALGFPLPEVTDRPNNAPTAAGPRDSLNIVIQDPPVTIEFRDITDGDIGQQRLSFTVENTAPTVVLVTAPVYDSVARVVRLTLDGLTEGTATVTLRIKDNGGTENGGVDETLFPIFVTVKPQGRFRDYAITTADGDQGADARVLTGKDDIDNNFGWLRFHTGSATFNGADNGPAFGAPTGIPRFVYAYYLRFDLDTLPFVGDAVDVSLAVNGKLKDATSPYQEDFVLYAVPDGYRGGDDNNGSLPELGETEWTEGNTPGLVVVTTAGVYSPGYQNAIVADNAPGFNEMASLNGVGEDFSPYRADVLQEMGTFKLENGSSKLVMKSDKMLEMIQNDVNGSVTFVLGIKRSTGPTFNAWPIYTGEDFGLEPTLTVNWDFVNSAKEVTDRTAINVFPNPSTGMVYLSDATDVARANVTDALGRQVATFGSVGAGNSLDLGTLPTGMYLLQLIDASGQSLQVTKVLRQ